MPCLRFPSASLATAKTASEPPFALRFSHPHLPVALRGLGRAVRGSLGQPLGWQPPGSSAVPGVVAAPSLPRWHLIRPVAPCLRYSRKGIGRKVGNEKEENGKERATDFRSIKS